MTRISRYCWLAVGLGWAAAAAAQEPDLLPGELPVEFGRRMVQPRRFPTISELLETVRRPQLTSAMVFRLYGDQHNHYAPQWSGDGRALSVLRSDIDAHTSKILLLPDLTATEPVVLYPDSDSYDHMFAWSAEGGPTFAFASTNEPAEQENLHLAVLGGLMRPRRVTSGPEVKSHPALWSERNRARMLFVAQDQVLLGTVDLRRPDAALRASAVGSGSEAAWSPDGRWMAWVEQIDLGGSGRHHVLKVRQRDGRVEYRVFSRQGMLLRNPVWSPNPELAGYIAYYARPSRRPHWQLMVCRAPVPRRTGGQAGPPAGATGPGSAVTLAESVRVDEHFQNFGPAWDPAAGRLWFFGSSEGQEYYPLQWVSVDGRRRGKLDYPRRLTTAMDVAANPDPQLRALAFCAIEELSQDVFVVVLNHE